jgi:hypothetical protein
VIPASDSYAESRQGCIQRERQLRLLDRQLALGGEADQVGAEQQRAARWQGHGDPLADVVDGELDRAVVGAGGDHVGHQLFSAHD